MSDKRGVTVAKSILYILTRVIIVVVIAVLLWMGFNIGMNSMNVYMITKDACSRRADTVLKNANPDTLSKLFTQDFILSDAVLNSDTYEDYTLTNYYERTDVDRIIVWPWQNKVTVKITEEVMDLTGTYTAEAAERMGLSEEEAMQTVELPAWQNGEYKVTLVKEEDSDSWAVDAMEFVTPIEQAEQKPWEIALEEKREQERAEQEAKDAERREAETQAAE